MIKSGCVIMLIVRLESVKLYSKIIEGEWRVGVFYILYNINVFLINDVKVKGIFII